MIDKLKELPETGRTITLHFRKEAKLYSDFDLVNFAKDIIFSDVEEFAISQESVLYVARALVFLGKIEISYIEINGYYYKVAKKGDIEPEFYYQFDQVTDSILDLLLGIT